jgi:hypothetical protein
MMYYVPESEAYDLWDNLLNEAPAITVGDCSWDQAVVLHEMDPVAYGDGFRYYYDTMGITVLPR